jgi:hypothetical protein
MKEASLGEVFCATHGLLRFSLIEACIVPRLIMNCGAACDV